jgi:hypothetical protein
MARIMWFCLYRRLFSEDVGHFSIDLTLLDLFIVSISNSNKKQLEKNPFSQTNKTLASSRKAHEGLSNGALYWPFRLT